MNISINRTGVKVKLRPLDMHSQISYFQVADEFGYKRIPVLDIENYDEIQWDGIEFNRLLSKDNKLYRFVEWLGQYPNLDGIVIEEIGTVWRD